MINWTLYSRPEIKALKPAARDFYIHILAYAHSKNHKMCLHQTLKDYYSLMGIEYTDADLNYDVWGIKRKDKFPTLFVIPAKHMEECYGFSPQYVSKLVRELIDAKVIRVKYHDKKGKANHGCFSRIPTVYEFALQ